MDSRDFPMVAGTVAPFIALSQADTPVTGLSVSTFLDLSLVAAFRDRAVRW